MISNGKTTTTTEPVVDGKIREMGPPMLNAVKKTGKAVLSITRLGVNGDLDGNGRLGLGDAVGVLRTAAEMN